MASQPLLPQVFWFRMSAQCARIENMPRTDAPGRLLDLPEHCALPDWAELQGSPAWARVRVGWNARGLGISVLANAFSDRQLLAGRRDGFAFASFWIDTRDTRNVSRATRFCHRFGASLTLGAGRALTAEITQSPISRAQADAPIRRSQVFESRAELAKSGWTLEVFVPAQALNGFDPDTNRRLGFAYQIGDHLHDDQFLNVGRDFPVFENPSLWTTLELRG